MSKYAIVNFFSWPSLLVQPYTENEVGEIV